MEKLINVIFENNLVKFTDPEAQNFYSKSKKYIYRTNKDYQVGQVIDIMCQGNVKSVLVTDINVSKDTINFPYDRISELEEYLNITDITNMSNK
jgi:hypothetical protein